MILGLSTSTFTLLHVLVSLIGIVSGFVVMYGLLINKSLNAWSAIFLISTLLTSLSGFAFPVQHILPSHILGILSLVALGAAISARYAFHLSGTWRRTYVIAASLSLYFNVFVLVVQLFEKVPALHALAPTGKEAPFAISQLIVLVGFIWLTISAAKKFRIEAPAILRRAA